MLERVLNLNLSLWGGAALPAFLVGGVGIVFLLLAVAFKRDLSRVLILIALLTTLLAISLSWRSWVEGVPLALGMLLFDRLAYALDLLFLISLFLTLLLSHDRVEGDPRGAEYLSLLLLATLGLMLIAHGADLFVIFLGVEVTSLAAYILAAFRPREIRSYESSLKYFILGSFASGFLLYGIAMTYGAVGSTSLAALSSFGGATSGHDPLLLLLAVALLLIGIGFKIASVPFHFWAPDVYEGAPTPVTAFMASAIKAGGFAILLRLGLALSHLPEIPWVPLLWALSFLSMTFGNLMALGQKNLKRMLAYSSIAHTGYALVGVTAAMKETNHAETAFASVLFYLLAYSVMTIGAFAVVVALARKGSEEPEELSDLAGLADRQPQLAALMSVFMLSLIGIPPTVGFLGKFYLFSRAISVGLEGLVVLAVLNSVVSVFYYMGPVVKMYFQTGPKEAPPSPSPFLLSGLLLCLLAVFYFGFFPSDLFLMAEESIRHLVF